MERNDNDDDNNVDETTNLLRGRSCDFSCMQMLSDMRSYHGALRFLSCYLENKEQDYIVTTMSTGIESGIMTGETRKL